ncbi:hypothetical protein DFJ73DRAFT_819345 [Zopfochytrium polystomum]|nr:hypothetical protein DFJ73DRAFT_819345 [Zopfochytrium polystomum]
MISWCRAKMGEAMFDDGIGGYYFGQRASVPVMFSNQCAAVLERLRNADAAEDGKSERAARRRPRIVDRAVFDIATANAYLPSFPLRVRRVRDLASCSQLPFFKGHSSPSHWHGQASSVCERSCTFCAASIGGLYFDWRLLGEFHGDEMARWHDHDGLWLVKTLLRRFEGFEGFDDSDGSTSGDSGGSAARTRSPTALFYADSFPEFENFPYHAYTFTVSKRTGRLMGLYSWFEFGERP